MIGAIIGDIVGSVYEFNNIKTKDFPLFSEKSSFTDDTIMTIAVAEALSKGGTADDFFISIKKFGWLYPNPHGGYGGSFYAWLFSNDREPYNSFGNGSAMRVSPCAWWANSLEEAEELAERSAAVTHNHPEGIKGAQSTAAAIYLARMKKPRKEIKSYIENKYGYDLSRTLDEIRPDYEFNESCQETVPEAIIAFLESESFEDAIRNAVSLGGDSDTLAAITGSIAEAAYGVPYCIKRKALGYLDCTLADEVYLWYDIFFEYLANEEIAILRDMGKTPAGEIATGGKTFLNTPLGIVLLYMNDIRCDYHIELISDETTMQADELKGRYRIIPATNEYITFPLMLKCEISSYGLGGIDWDKTFRFTWHDAATWWFENCAGLILHDKEDRFKVGIAHNGGLNYEHYEGGFRGTLRSSVNILAESREDWERASFIIVWDELDLSEPHETQSYEELLKCLK